MDQQNDSGFYWAMANGHIAWAPFGYRIMVPTVVRMLPLEHHVGFVLLTAAATTFAATALYAVLRRRVDRMRAAAGVAILLTSGPVIGQLHDPYGTDMAMAALVAIALLFVDRRRWAAYGVAAALGVTARDAAVLTALVPMAAYLRTRDRRSLMAAVAILIVFLMVRTTVPVVPRAVQMPSEIIPWRIAHDGGLAQAALLALGSSFGGAWLLVPAGWRRLRRSERAWALVAVGAVATWLIASDWGRLLLPAFPLVCLAAIRSEVGTPYLFAVAALTGIVSVMPSSLVAAGLTLSAGVAALAVDKLKRERGGLRSATQNAV